MNTTGSGVIIDVTPDGGHPTRPRDWGVQANRVTALAIMGGVILITVAVVIWTAVTLVPLLLVLGFYLHLMSRLRSWLRRRNFLAR